MRYPEEALLFSSGGYLYEALAPCEKGRYIKGRYTIHVRNICIGYQTVTPIIFLTPLTEAARDLLAFEEA